MTLLHNGDAFPKLQVHAVDGGTVSLPGDLAGSWAVVLTYRGEWCPLCNTQLAEYANEKGALDALGVKVVALSVDNEATGVALVAKHNLRFPVGHNANADEVKALVGAFTNDSPHYLQPTAFILAPDGAVMTAVYSTNAVGRLVAADVVKFVGYMKSREPANVEAAE